MKKKTRKVLSLLVQDRDYVTAKEIAESLGMSRRSVMYALDDLDDELAAAGLRISERVTNKGIRIAPQELVQVASLLELGAKEELLDFTDARDRRFFLLFNFICIDAQVTTELLSERTSTSSRTVSSDVSSLRDLMRGQNLELAYDKKRGYEVVGNVFTTRNLFVQWMSAICPVETLGGLAITIEGLYKLAGEAPRCALGAAEIGQINQMLGDVIPKRYTKKADQALIQHLIVALMSSNRCGSLGFSEADKAFLAKSVSFDVARIVCLRAQEIAGVQMAEGEDCYFATLLQSLPTNTEVNDGQNYPFEIEVIVQKLILDVSESYQYDFWVDSELFQVIVGHVIPLVYRVLFNSQNKNPLLGEVAGRYARLNEAVRGALGGIESYAGASVTDDECSFLTLYFASSIEKMSNESGEKARVIVVCNAGNAVSRLLQYKLTSAFNVEVVASVAEADVYASVNDLAPIDLIVTVVDLDQERLGLIQCLKVSPLLSDADMNHLGRRLRQRIFLTPEPESEGASLVDLLAPSCFEVVEFVDGMDELIKEGGRLLNRAGLCDEEYPLQMVSAAHCFGPLTTILIAPGIIMPHAGISDHVFRTGFSFIRVREPVEVNGKDVTCALSLCTRNKRINQRAIQQFGALLGRSAFMERVDDIETYDQLVALINDCLKEAERK